MDRLDLSNLKIGANFRDEIDTLCKKCGNLKSQCQCQRVVELKSRDSYFLWINKQKKSGKEVTLCGIFFENKEVLENLLKSIKKKMACGGVLRQEEGGYVMEFQGEHLQSLREMLKKEKFKFKK